MLNKSTVMKWKLNLSFYFNFLTCLGDFAFQVSPIPFGRYGGHAMRVLRWICVALRSSDGSNEDKFSWDSKIRKLNRIVIQMKYWNAKHQGDLEKLNISLQIKTRLNSNLTNNSFHAIFDNYSTKTLITLLQRTSTYFG